MYTLKYFKDFVNEKVEFRQNFISFVKDLAPKNYVAKQILMYAENNDDLTFDWVEFANDANMVSVGKGNKKQEMKIGKFITKILPNVKPHKIEEFIQILKKSKVKLGDFEIWTGEKLRSAYDPKNFTNIKDCSLYQSCLSDEGRLKNLNLYTENKNVSVLVLLNDEKKVIGRALLWKAIYMVSTDQAKPVVLMDKVYSIDSRRTGHNVRNFFIQYAKDHDMLYVYLDRDYALDKNGTKYGNEFVVTLENVDFEFYPYVDFLKYFDVVGKKLSNRNGEFILQMDAENFGKPELKPHINCATCEDKRDVLCPTCDGSSVIDGPNGETLTCPTCEGRAFIDCPDCTK